MAMSDDKTPPVPDHSRNAIPRPPTREDIDQISSDQALITDEWGGEPAAGEGTKKP